MDWQFEASQNMGLMGNWQVQAQRDSSSPCCRMTASVEQESLTNGERAQHHGKA
jgi:hypothetical protein